jgi:uncharacterized protein involved in outer membrane biogenesis
MRLFLKVMFIGVGLVLIAVAILALLAATQADKAARYQAENALRYIFQTEVHVKGAELSLLGQTLKLKDISIGNPKGFEGGPAMAFKQVEVKVQGTTIFSENPVINEVIVSEPTVNLQYVPKEGTNLGILLNQAKRASLAQHSEQPRTVRRAFQVKNLRCERGRINFSTSVVPTPNLGIDVTPFTVQDLSKDHPVTPSQISAVFIKSILTEAATFNGLLRPVGEFIRDEMNKLLE